MRLPTPTSREIEIDPEATAILYIDVQNFNCRRDGGEYVGLDDATVEARYGYFFREMARRGIPNMQRLQAACRAGGIEVMYTVVENLTQDGRDRSLDYKITGFNVPKGSPDAKVIEELQPLDDEIVLPKTSSSVFISTNIDYVLRNLGVRHLILVGVLTDQCVDSAIRDACDLGYLVTVPTDACVTQSEERQETSLRNNRGYGRQISTAALVSEIERLTVGRVA
jgi:ureidoacrylate peracid hydrolase